MDPVQLVRLPAFTVVGLLYRGKNENDEIPQLWERFYPAYSDRIQPKSHPHVSYGVMDNFDHESGVFDYIACYEVEVDVDVPEGMVKREIPSQTYAVFRGTLPDLMALYSNAYEEWLPQSGYQRAPGPEFEQYNEEFDPSQGKLTLYLYVPIVASP